MEEINRERLKKFLETERLNVEVARGGAEKEDTIGITQNISLVLSKKNGTQTVYKGYTVQTFCGKKPIEKQCKTIRKLFSYLNRIEAFSGDTIEVVSYNGRFPTYEKYLEEREFETIGMEKLLERYLPYADQFSLTCPYNDGYTRECPNGIYRLSKEHADAANAAVRKETMRELNRLYSDFSDADKTALPPFEDLVQSIEQEIAKYRQSHPDEAEKYGGNTFFCDKFSSGETQYVSPQELWHFYHHIDLLFTLQWSSDRMQKNKEERSLDCELNAEYYAPLKACLQNIEVTFFWHCTRSSMLSKVFYFKLNEISIKWLKQLRNDYDMRELEDLAFYSGDKLLFSCCTHEGFHTDYLEDAEGKV